MNKQWLLARIPPGEFPDDEPYGLSSGIEQNVIQQLQALECRVP